MYAGDWEEGESGADQAGELTGDMSRSTQPSKHNGLVVARRVVPRKVELQTGMYRGPGQSLGHEMKGDQFRAMATGTGILKGKVI